MKTEEQIWVNEYRNR
ncbi:hypothetical protein PENARI_c003G00946 [Penicillium arizonense]|uniref:Uncharacterized protein n=1 Tax=Penicillium arizonense TaxID=1835702 RepID=A0A1F5LSV2_PENAI|nr:hypothetical protein PENARI_c003G00946 [Penicillium arizonense]